ncbi:MAG: hypothetical protein QXX87_00055 [Candidatus Jordarchaeales archaeon]
MAVQLREKIVDFVRGNVKLSMIMEEGLGDVVGLISEPYEHFLSRRLQDLLMRQYEGAYLLLSFLENYVSTCLTVKRLFLDVLYSLGLADDYRNVLQDGSFFDRVRVSVPDETFLRLYLKASINALAPSIDSTLNELPLGKLEEEARRFESRFLQELILMARVQSDRWNMCREDLSTLLEKIEAGNTGEVVEAVMSILKTLRPSVVEAEGLLRCMASKLGAGEEGEVISLMGEVLREFKNFVERWEEAHRTAVNYLRFVITMVWGDVKEGLEKLKRVVKGESVEELVPKKLAPMDVAFAASRAMIELGEAVDISKAQMENFHFFLLAADLLESPLLASAAKNMEKRFRALCEFQQEMFEELEEIRMLAEEQARL